MYNEFMKKAFIIHGAYGSPDENWFPWLKDKLAEDGYEVITPTFPTPENQSLDTWNKVFDEYLVDLDDATILVGHSLACPFILHVLQNGSSKVRAAYLVSGFHTLLDHPIDEINKTFVENEFAWDDIKASCEKIVMFSGDNDPYIKRSIADELAERLDAEYIVVPEGGHLNATAGYTKFDGLLNKIREA